MAASLCSAALYAFDSEAAILGAAMYAPEKCEAAFDLLRPDLLGDGTHALIWNAIAEVYQAGGLPTPEVIRDRLGANAQFAEWGGFDVLWGLWSNANPATISSHVQAVVDRAGRRRLARLLADVTVRVGDTSEALGDLVEALEQGLLASSPPVSDAARLVPIGEAADEVLYSLDGADVAGTSTGIPALDLQMGPMLAGEMILVAARPGMAKSAFAGNVAQNIARSGLGFIEVNLEMSVAQMTRRHLTNIAHERYGSGAPEYKDIKRRKVTPEQRRMLEAARDELRNVPLYMTKRSGLTLAGLRSLVRRQTAVWARAGIELGAVSIDHVGLLRSGQSVSRYEEQTAVAMGLKEFAGEIGKPVIGLVQLNREVEKRDNKRPQLFDLKDTGAWEENADVVIGLYRDAYYALKEPEPKDDGALAAVMKWQDWQRRRMSRELEAILLKIREGEEATVPLWVDVARNAVRGHEPGLWGEP